eukprot:15239974-Alexandrium_andersonii.AAC.1
MNDTENCNLSSDNERRQSEPQERLSAWQSNATKKPGLLSVQGSERRRRRMCNCGCAILRKCEN